MSSPDRRAVLITGVSGGIGMATAKYFSQEGWQVIGFDLAPPAHDICDIFMSCDLSQPDQIIVAFDAIRTHEESLHAVVNNAAVQICKPFTEMTLDEWNHLMGVNVTASFLCAQQAHPLLRAAGGGCIINVSSVHALATSQDIAAYATSKGALVAMTRALALELADQGIRVNAVLPGAVDTSMLRAGFSRGHIENDLPQVQFDEFSQKHPLRRVAKPEEIASAIVFLADGAKASYITGESLVVDGGVTARLSTE